MGQRTFLLVKKNFGNGVSEINLIHDQFGIGKVMPSKFLQELLRSGYDLDSSAKYSREYLPSKHHFTFKPASNEDHNYIYERIVKSDNSEYDIWDFKTRDKIVGVCDNNNGGMLIEVTQKLDKDGKPRTYGNCMDVKIGFVLGDEEIHMWNSHFNDCIDVEKPFDRIVSVTEFMDRTWGMGKEEGSNEMFAQSFNTICDLFGVEQVVEEERAKEVAEKWEKTKVLVEFFTKDLGEREIIEIPKELKEHIKVYS